MRILLFLSGNFDDVSIGECYHYGRRVAQDLVTARKYYLAAAKRGEPRAFQQLSNLAAEQGKTVDALFYKAMMHELKHEWLEARTAYEQAAQTGHPDALFRLGQLYEEDRFSVSSCIIRKDKEKELVCYRRAAAAYSKHALDRLVSRSNNDSEVAFILAKMYELGEIGNTSNITKALEYFLLAAQNGKKEALAIIENNSRYCDDAMQFQLADVYETKFNDFPNALNWFVILARKNHRQASRRIERLIESHIDCVYIVGNLYEKAGDIDSAIRYFFMACRKGHQQALMTIEKYVDHLKDADKFELAQFYRKSNRNLSAVSIYKKMADSKNKKAVEEMNVLANALPECANHLATHYEQENNVERAYHYYVVAAKTTSYKPGQIFVERLKREAEAGVAIAQFYYGCSYLKHLNQLHGSAHWAMRAADQGIQAAAEYLDKTCFTTDTLLYIARGYATGNSIKKNNDRAIQFYQKVIAVAPTVAEFELGELYLRETTLANNVANAIHWLIIANKNGHPDSLPRLNALAAAGHVEVQYYLGCKKEYTPASIHWMMLAAEQGYKPAKAYLDSTIFSADMYRYIASSYARGEGVPVSVDSAINFYRRATKLNDALAYLELGELLLTLIRMEDHAAEGVRCLVRAAQLGNEKALNRVEQLARAGNVRAQHSLGCEYYNTHGRESESIYWAMLAADQGYQPAINFMNMQPYTIDKLVKIARKYMTGEDVRQNTVRAMSFYGRAAKLGDAESAYIVGQHHQRLNETDLALDYYVIAQRAGHQNVLGKIEELATARNARAQYLCSQHYADQQDYYKAIQLALLAAEQGNKAAEDYLANSVFSVTHYRSIAARYATGDGVRKNQQKAILFLEKAISLKDAEAAFRLAELYLDDQTLSVDTKKKAAELLVIAAKWNHKEALARLTDIATSGDTYMQLFLAREYFHRQQEFAEAIEWAMRAAALDYAPAKAYLDQKDHPPQFYVCMARKYQLGEGVPQNKVAAIRFYQQAVDKKDANAALLFAEFYLAYSELENHKKQAYLCLAKAAQWGNEDAFAKLERDANAGIIEAQYSLGCEYHHYRQERFKAVDWAIRAADQRHPQARMYMENTIFPAEIYRYIAKKYENADNINQDIKAAILYYNKAIQLKDKEAARELGELYLAHDELAENKSHAFIAFIKALQLGHDDAMATLECLGHEVVPSLQLALGDLYQHPPFNNQVKAIYWYQQACEGGSIEAKSYLSRQ